MKKKVMLADDEEDILALFSATLGDDERFDVLLARDGEETLKLAQREKPDLLFLDLLMPKINGYEVCRRLKGNPETSSIKVIVLTALVEESGEERARIAGAEGYLTKPFSPLALLDKVEETLFARL